MNNNTQNEDDAYGWHELNRLLLDAAEQYRSLQKARSQRSFIRQRLVEESERLKQLERQLHKEKKEYEQMNRLSIRSLFYSILKSKEEQQEKEKQEYLAAELKWQQCTNELKELEADQLQTTEQISLLEPSEALYHELFDRKEKMLQVMQDLRFPALQQLSGELSEQRSRLKEMREAMEAGVKLIDCLDHTVLNNLRSASNWGTWDLLGGGMISTMVKRGKMDDANRGIHAAQHLLNQFNKELGDINAAQHELNMGGFTGFADYFFDGLIVDWMVQSGIRRAWDVAVKVREKAYAAVTELNTAISRQQSDLQELEENYRQQVEAIH